MSPTYPQHLTNIPYLPNGHALQTLDIWLPRPLSQSPPESHVWIIYLHGGAWRDPLLTSTEIDPTLTHLLPPSSNSAGAGPSKALTNIAAIASLNYTLSPYPSHPSHPSAPGDSARNGRHPDHVADVAAALAWLGREHSVGGSEGDGGYQYVAVGHSCGASMWAQLIASLGASLPSALRKPVALVGLAGIYDLPALLRNNGEGYRGFLEAAFGAEGDGSGWRGASPVQGVFGRESWGEGRLVMLGWSERDGLVEGAQGEGMKEVLVKQGWSEAGKWGARDQDVERERPERAVVEVELEGRHDEVWQGGWQVVKVLEIALGWLFRDEGMIEGRKD